ncbi:MAG: heme-binding beta-barrel domain-containing protein [Burkholderiales bacterium]
MPQFPSDIYTDPEFDAGTLKNLGPLTPMAGLWPSQRGLGVHPASFGLEKQADAERYELQPIDPQTNGPQLYYGLRYPTQITKPGEVKTFHDKTGYWLWEPATSTVIHTLSIPRGQVAMAGGNSSPDAKRIETATPGSASALQNVQTRQRRIVASRNSVILRATWGPCDSRMKWPPSMKSIFRFFRSLRYACAP